MKAYAAYLFAPGDRGPIFGWVKWGFADRIYVLWWYRHGMASVGWGKEGPHWGSTM